MTWWKPNDPLDLYEPFLEGIQREGDLDFQCSNNNYFGSSYQGRTLASKEQSKELEWRIIFKTTVSWTL